MQQKLVHFFTINPKSTYFWSILFSSSIALNLVNYYSLDGVFSFLFIIGAFYGVRSVHPTEVTQSSHSLKASPNESPRGKIKTFLTNFYFTQNALNYLIILFLTSGIIGYLTSSPLGPQQWEDILGLRWVLGFYAFYFAGKKLKEAGGNLALIPFLPLFPVIYILISHWHQSGGKLIVPDLRLQGFYQNPNHLALAIVLPWAFILGQIAIKETAKNKSFHLLGFFANSLTLILLFLISMMLLATYSRTAWTGALLSLIVSIFYVKSRKHSLYAFAAFSAIALCLVFNIFSLRTRLFYSFDVSSHSAQNLRIIAWKAAWHIFLDHPFFGVGFAENARLFPLYYAKLGFNPTDVIGNAHNQYLEILSGAGIFGFIGYIGIFIGGLFFFHRTFTESNSTSIKRTALSCILVIVALFGSSFTDTPFRLHECRNFLMILLGFSFGYLSNTCSTHRITN